MIGGLPAARPQPDDLLATSEAGDAAIRGGALRIGSFAGGSLISIAGGALLFRHLGVIEGGRYMTALSLAALVGGLTDLGLSAVGIRELATLEGEKRARLASNLLGIRLVLTTIGVLLVTIFALLSYDGLLAAGVVVAGAGVLIASVQATYALPLMAELRLGWVSALDLAKQIGSVMLIIGFVVAGAGLLPFLATPALMSLVILVPTALLVRGNIPLRPSFVASEWRALVAPVLTYSLAVAAGALYFRIAIVLVSLLSGATQLGYFSLSFRIVEVLLLIPGLLVGSAFPIFARAARDDPARLGYALTRVFEVSLIAGAWFALTLAIGAPLAVEIMGGGAFAPAAPVLAIQGLGLGATFVGAVWAYGLLSVREHRTILVFNVTALLALTATVAVLASIDGARGAAIATAGVEVAAAVAGAVLLARRRPHLRPALGVVPKVAAAALLGATPLIATDVPDALQVLLSTLLYGAALLALRAVPRELLVLLPGRARGARRD